MIALLRRRQILLPTVWGWLLLLALLGAALLAARRPLYQWLAPIAPAPGATVLVVEGWMDYVELKRAAHLMGPRPQALVMTSGGAVSTWPDARIHAERAAEMLQSIGIDKVLPVPAPDTRVDRTYTSALAVREVLRQRGPLPRALTVYSPGVHARRSRLLYQMAFGPEIEVGVVAVEPQRYDPQRWWAGSDGAKTVLGELQAWLWTKCCFWPEPPEP